jgi:hypothetical protein
VGRRRKTTITSAAPTVQLAPIEIEALLSSAQATDPAAETIEMIPLVAPIADDADVEPPPPPPRLARGTRRSRVTLRVDEIVPPKKR